MKVNSATRQNLTNANLLTDSTKAANQSHSNTPANFTEAIKANLISNADIAFQNLISQIREQGARFIKTPDEESLNLYKESITLFLKELRNNFLNLKEELGAKKNGEQKVYQTINAIEDEITSLTKEALSDSKATELLCALDDVRGLVLDILG